MFYVAHRLFAAHDRFLGAMIAQRLRAAVGMSEVFLPFCDTDEEDLVAEVKGRRLFDLDLQHLADLDGMLAVLHGPSLDDGVCMEIGYAAALGVPVVVLTTDFQTYGTSEHGAALHFPDALVQAVVTEIVRVNHLAPPVDNGTRFEAFRDRNLGQLATAVSLAVDRLVYHARSSSTRGPAAPEIGPFAVCERSPHYSGASWARVMSLLGSRGYRVHQSERFSAANPTPDGVDLAERYRQILSQPGRLALDRSFVSELVYGPLRHGGSRLTDVEAYDLAALVARRDGVLVHLTATASAIRARLLVRDGPAAACLADIKSLITAYERVVATFTAYLPVVRLDTR